MPEDERDHCIDCKAFDPYKNQEKPDVTVGSCHSDPPIFMPGKSIATWPTVFGESGWCLAFERKKSRVAKA